jgi:hypothetical protein
MSHDKIKAAARRRMAETGEPYATARREVLKEHPADRSRVPLPDTKRFAISYRENWLETVLNGALRLRPDASGVEVDPAEVRVRMGWAFRLDVPRAAIRSASRSQARLRGTTGVHGHSGRWLVNGSADGLVELTIEPPCYIERQLSTLYRRETVNSLTLSLVDPGGFIAALEHDGHM